MAAGRLMLFAPHEREPLGVKDKLVSVVRLLFRKGGLREAHGHMHVDKYIRQSSHATGILLPHHEVVPEARPVEQAALVADDLPSR